MKILIVSWEYPPVVVGGLGRHVHHLATELAAAGHEVVVLSRRPVGHRRRPPIPTVTHIAEGVLVVAVAEDPPHFVFGEDMLAWTLAMGHAMVRAGVALRQARRRRGLEARRRARARLAGRAPGDRAGRVLRRAAGLHAPRHRGRPAQRLGLGPDQPAGALGRVVAGQRIRRADHLLGVDAGRGRPAVRSAAAADHGDPQRNRRHHLELPRSARRAPARRDCCTSAGSNTRRACRTPSPRCPGSAAATRAPRWPIAGEGTQFEWLQRAGPRRTGWPGR